MTHTLPDYTTKYKMTNIFSNIDTAELAVRLGSGVIYDRRGNVVDYDDFEHGSLKWDNDFTAHAGTVAVSTDTARSGGKSLKIVTANAVADRMNIYRYVTPTFNTNIGMELSFAGVSSYYRLWMYVAGWLSPASFQA